jgi:hypothetical protein
MRKKSPVFPAAWWRFDRYQIAAGAIRPAPKARLETFDPWNTFARAKGQFRTVETIWGNLAELVRQLEQDAVAECTPSSQGEKLILDWCHRYGLLGLLPGTAVKIDLPPTYQDARRSFGVSSPSGRLRAVEWESYGQVAGHWLRHTRQSGEFNVKRTPWTAGQRAAVGPEESYRTVSWSWIDFEWKTETTVNVLKPYFVQPTPACPLSARFWSTYQEPIRLWVHAAKEFVASLELISNHATQRFAREKVQPEEELKINQALWRLNSLAASQASYYEFGSSVLTEQAASASLLSAMAKMFLLDIIDRRRLIRCATCGRIFVSNEPKSQYCKIACRSLAQTRRYRSRVKAFKESRRQIRRR